VAQGAARLKEAAKLGFNRAIAPEAARGEGAEPGLKVIDIASLASLVADIAAEGKARMAAKTHGQDG
jgi:DNA repair protein RadA/Sms